MRFQYVVTDGPGAAIFNNAEDVWIVICKAWGVSHHESCKFDPLPDEFENATGMLYYIMRRLYESSSTSGDQLDTFTSIAQWRAPSGRNVSLAVRNIDSQEDEIEPFTPRVHNGFYCP